MVRLRGYFPAAVLPGVGDRLWTHDFGPGPGRSAAHTSLLRLVVPLAWQAKPDRASAGSATGENHPHHEPTLPPVALPAEVWLPPGPGEGDNQPGLTT